MFNNSLHELNGERCKQRVSIIQIEWGSNGFHVIRELSLDASIGDRMNLTNKQQE